MKKLGDHFSPPNILTVDHFLEGESGWGMGLFSTLLMTRGGLESAARMDLFYLDWDAHAGTVVSLEALLDGQVVATDSFIILGQSPPKHAWREMAMEGVTFDTLRLGGSGFFGGFFGSLDNVEIVPAPGASWACLGLLLLRRRR